MIKMADTKGVGSVDLEDFMAIMQRGKLFDWHKFNCATVWALTLSY
jgi:hypothetical protein